VVKRQDTLLLLRCNRRHSLDVLGPAALLLGVTVAEDNFRLNLFGLARENDLTIVLTVLSSILEVLDKDSTIWGSVYLLSLANVLSDSQEGDLLIVRAILWGKINDLGGQLILHGLN
jgi:hypothetical protein